MKPQEQPVTFKPKQQPHVKETIAKQKGKQQQPSKKNKVKPNKQKMKQKK